MSQRFTLQKKLAIISKMPDGIRSPLRCVYCGDFLVHPSRKIKNKYARKPCTFDHVVSKKSGGSNDDSNLVPCCQPCNASKAEKSVESFRLLYMRKQMPINFSEQQIEVVRAAGIDLFKIFKIDKHFFYIEKCRPNREG